MLIRTVLCCITVDHMNSFSRQTRACWNVGLALFVYFLSVRVTVGLVSVYILVVIVHSVVTATKKKNYTLSPLHFRTASLDTYPLIILNVNSSAVANCSHSS